MILSQTHLVKKLYFIMKVNIEIRLELNARDIGNLKRINEF